MLAPIVATLIAAVTFTLIFTEVLDRTVGAMIGATAMFIAGLSLGFYSEAQAVEAVEFDALALLLGMMILVSILEPTGFFQYIAVKASQFSQGDPWRLLLILGVGTALVSAFFNNVTTVVLVGPVAILITELLGLNPVPFLMAQGLLSATAGVGTSIGDPASMLVASASGASFTDFLTHSMPVVIIAVLVILLMLRFIFAKQLSVKPIDPEVVNRLDANEALRDRTTTYRVLLILTIAIGTFVFQRALHLSSGSIALAAATAALVWVRPDLREVLKRVDWPVLIFFIALFVVIGGLSAAGVFEPITMALAPLGRTQPVLLGVIIIWVVAGFSGLVDNVPITIAMISLLNGLSAIGVDVSALWWAVVFGAGFGGNATCIGSTANIIIVSLSERTHSPITPAMWSRSGLPVAIVTCIVGSFLFVLIFPWLGR